MTKEPIRLLVVDDSAYNRRNIAETFATFPEVTVVGKAADGEEALRLASLLKPDVITLDLEMPRMDGFTFLRILMSRTPIPVIVISSYAQRENIFKALELGALDFVAKPTAQIAFDATSLREQIAQKVLLVQQLRSTPRLAASAVAAARRHGSGPVSTDGRATVPDVPTARTSVAVVAPDYVVAIASSTGGPSALLEIFSKVPRTSTAAIVVAQHMPDKFTRTFADRLDRRGVVRTSEAEDGDRVGRLMGFVCPGQRCMEVVQNGTELRISVTAPRPDDRYVPSADRLLKSVAQAAGTRAIGIILTGMGDDGAVGARAIRDAGGLVIAESQETAVVYGMPGAVVRAGIPHKVLSLPEIADCIAHLG
ncbi:MAG: chemotaxis-specific protein-glutamate methyltransferase CheB [Polyangiaceae bacterium]|nr:chemotaxis-specific protein-glutamate methyltransferase CheB [Polyangiaceae bacterium]